MIYITYELTQYSEWEIKNVWSVKHDDVRERYNAFMQEKAKEMGIVINPHHLNMMNIDHNKHLDIIEYDKTEKKWDKLRRKWNIDKFIADVLGGHKEAYKELCYHEPF